MHLNTDWTMNTDAHIFSIYLDVHWEPMKKKKQKSY